MTKIDLTPKSHSLQLYNTLTRQKEPLKPLDPTHVKMYTCGPTVYNFAHIGNFRTYIFEDLLRRTIQFFGFKITQVMNLTDVDDKTIKGAIEQNVTLDEYTQKYKNAFFDDLKTLGIQPAEHYPAATDFIPEMIAMIQDLQKKGYAYVGGDGSIYYAIQKFPHYGCLSHLELDQLQSGASQRVASDEYEKDNVADFVLWKKYDAERDGNIFWDSPFGAGRPGWHLECSAMAVKILGKTLDIHVGGIDNMFPHHENEIAQSEACTGCKFVNLWMHSEHLVVDGKKMSKSLGNFFTLRQLLDKGYQGSQIRYLLLQTHYKTQLNFTFAGLDAAQNSLTRLNDFIQRLKEIPTTFVSTEKATPFLQKAFNSFAAGLADDLNISASLAAMFDLVREINSLCDSQQVGFTDAQNILALLEKFNFVLGVLVFEKQEELIPQEIQNAFEQRQIARKEKKWQDADLLRDFILNGGYVIEDTPNGARLKKTETHKTSV